MTCLELPWPHQSAIQRPGTGTNNNQGDRDARRKQVVFESLAFLVAVPVHKETVWPVNCDDSHEHHARMPKAAMRVKSPTARPREPRNSAAIASRAKTAGITESVKYFM